MNPTPMPARPATTLSASVPEPAPSTSPTDATALSARGSGVPSAAPSGETPGPRALPKAGRPPMFSTQAVETLCSIIRQTGISDSGAAARAKVHPSTVSRWKKEHPEIAISLRSAREDFRLDQLSIILGAADHGGPNGWKAAAWMLERTFPQDYSPRAKERALFQERYDEVCAREEEAMEAAWMESEAASDTAPANGDEGGALQNVINSNGDIPVTEEQGAALLAYYAHLERLNNSEASGEMAEDEDAEKKIAALMAKVPLKGSIANMFGALQNVKNSGGNTANGR